MLKSEIDEFELKGAIVLEPRHIFDDAIIAIGYNDDDESFAVYGYYALMDALKSKDGMSDEEASDWIGYNTLGSIPNMGKRRPMVVWEVYR